MQAPPPQPGPREAEPGSVRPKPPTPGSALPTRSPAYSCLTPPGSIRRDMRRSRYAGGRGMIEGAALTRADDPLRVAGINGGQIVVRQAGRLEVGDRRL